MNSIKEKLLDELMEHISQLQGRGLKSRMDEMNEMKMKEKMPEDMGSMMHQPKGVSVEKVELMGKPEKELELGSKPGSDKSMDDMSPEEMEELMEYYKNHK